MPSSSMRALAGLALAGLVTSSFVPMAGAGEGKGGSSSEGRVVATGLDSPRHLTAASNGDLYVAEAGTGGDDCVLGHVPGVDGEVPVCAGTTGAVTKVTAKGHQRQVVKGLPSLALGAEVMGTSDVEVKGSTLMISVGLGNPPVTRDRLVADHGKVYKRLATVQSARLKGKKSPTLRTEADVARFETKKNPDEGLLDTNPNSIAKDKKGWLVADAGGNYVARLDRDRLRVVTVLPNGETEFPPGSSSPFPFQPVPTSAVRGPDGATYVSQLTGFPFPQGAASIWRVGKDGTPQVWATGLTNVTDLAFDRHGHLYVIQISDTGLGDGLPSGSLVRVNKGSAMHETVADDLDAPFGLALHKGNAYVTTCTVCADGGQVMKFDLDD